MTEQTFLTPEAKAKLEAELEELTKELEMASSGDDELAHVAEEFAEEFEELEERAEHHDD